AALPTVEFSTVKEDLSRRDFTVNAMAIAISRKNFGQLIDFFGGQRDLFNRKIKVLHDASFMDDPTRIFRAVRFEQRFNFRIEPRTEGLIKEALKKKMLHATEKQRLRDELILILKEEGPKRMLKRMGDLGELRFINPGLSFTARTEGLFDSIKETVSWFKLAYLKKRGLDVWLMYLMALLDGLTRDEVRRVCDEFALRRSEKVRLLSYKNDGPAVLRFMNRKGRIAPSRIYELFEPLSYEVILALMAKSRSAAAKKRISDFLTKYNGARLLIKGKDLEMLGLKGGPHFKKILEAALRAKLDRNLALKRQELEFVKRFIARGGGGL
ncbi:MAG: CCA tRNA nucleotidyltransferase, partial [Candidatus Omnitrophica bacterium]|nr:CCA tRNA nucleotidyltransferase [Candidatus Omnitrophota bacterium]